MQISFSHVHMQHSQLFTFYVLNCFNCYFLLHVLLNLQLDQMLLQVKGPLLPFSYIFHTFYLMLNSEISHSEYSIDEEVMPRSFILL